MKTDRELLELAAKAAGLYWRQDIADYRNEKGILGLWIKEPMKTLWNPLTDDGDALRLAVRLKIDIHQRVVEPRVAAIAAMQSQKIESVADEKQRLAATRRSIVRSAAAIGESMP